MNKVIEWFTRKKMFIISIIGTFGFVVLLPRKVIYAIYDTHCFLCVDITRYAILFFMIGATILVPSVIVFFVKQKVFESWKKTLFIYLFIYLLNIIFMPWYWGDEFFHFEKDIIALVISACYIVFSLFFITYQSLKKE